jgi:heme-degrading monooxygenase HmoA
MQRVWTHSTWTVKPGREDEFVEVWRAMAARATAQLNTAAPPTLLRDRDSGNVFVSFGRWPTGDEAKRFRASPIFREAYEKLEELLDNFHARTLDEVFHG